ncbi:ERCC4 domain-containing protein [Cyclobacterium jeungdonense]|uniref:ERCC4 domain-containing protein n=1 Tax=Cyclobacterium jeungdonense TaxID=708087 RepID=A0ABT8C3P3_9BACT|nr:ERCC4 domain-containing protein [Cyclobacterium jeungdonense]MDN3686707.1 ERCC4 domain-containing protein [Cyclobacterium jeungdonense]
MPRFYGEPGSKKTLLTIKTQQKIPRFRYFLLGLFFRYLAWNIYLLVVTQMTHITADYRESPSGIPKLLIQKGYAIDLSQLGTGDYIINDELIVERKSAKDFLQSLISNRLFDQCSRLIKTGMRPLMLLEGNPLQTSRGISEAAVKGALLSVIASWQIPIVYSVDKKDSADMLGMLAGQREQAHPFVRKSGFKPKRIRKRQLWFLQGLPNTGAVRASKLLEYFSTIEAVIGADTKTLCQVPGLGKKTAEKIRSFVSGE